MVTFRVGMAGVMTDVGLGVHWGVPVLCTGVTVQESATSMAEVEFTVRVEADLPPGNTANGDRGMAVRLKACPKAGATAETSTIAISAAKPRKPGFKSGDFILTLANFILSLDFNEMEVNMSRGWFN